MILLLNVCRHIFFLSLLSADCAVEVFFVNHSTIIVFFRIIIIFFWILIIVIILIGVTLSQRLCSPEHFTEGW